VSINIINMLMS